MDNNDKNKNNSFLDCECGKEKDGRKLRGAHKAFGSVFLRNHKCRQRLQRVCSIPLCLHVVGQRAGLHKFSLGHSQSRRKLDSCSLEKSQALNSDARAKL